MKKCLLTFLTVFFLFSNGQTWSKLAGGEGYQGYINSYGGGGLGYSEVLNQFSPKNLPDFYPFDTSYSYQSDCARWNVNDEFIYLYENRSGNVNFWMFDTAIKQWKKLNDTSTANYGVQGVASATNFPGDRVGAVTWVDNNGDLWMYGNAYFPKQTDMWKYDRSANMWIWISGTQADTSSLPAQQGVASATALPKTYKDSYSWVDSQNNLWFFGGSSVITLNNSSNQVWKYNTATNQWTWMKGSNDSDYQYAANVLGTENVESAANSPGEKYMYKGAYWQDNNYIYLLPGDGQPIMWRYNMLTNNWSHVKKTATASTFYNYGTIGVENNTNFPPAVLNPSYWKDNAGNFWMFGGEVKDSEYYLSGNVDYRAWVNTLWKYNPTTNNWTWMRGKNPLSYTLNVNSTNSVPFNPGYYGNKNVTSDKNMPSSRNRSIFWKQNNELFFANGEGYLSGNPLRYTDVWKYDIASNNFTWIGGRTASSNNLEYIEDAVNPSVYNIPIVKNYFFDGVKTVYAFRQSKLNEIWAFDMVDNTWQCIKPGQTSNYGTIGVEAPTNAPYRTKNIWLKDGNLYMLGAEAGSNTPSSLWKFDITTKNYTCLKKSSYSPGTINQPNASNFPMATYEAANWVNDNKLYTLGGGDSDTSYSDFWEYDFNTNIWTRKNGLPTKLTSMSYAKDSGNNVWIFGGTYGTDDSSQVSKKNNNVWKFNYATKVWQQLQGGPENALGNYGTQNISTNTTRPGGRASLAYWMDKYDRLWIYCGQGYSETPSADYYSRFLNDLWFYDTHQNKWFWVSGSKNNILMNEFSNGYYDNSRFISSEARTENTFYPFMYNDKHYLFAASSFYGNKINGLWKLDVDNVPSYNFVGGNATLDADNNSCSATDPKYKSLKVTAQNGSNSAVAYTDDLGNYSIVLNQLNTATITPMPEIPAYFNVSPSSANINFTSGNNMVTQNFCVTPNGIHNDLEIKIIPMSQSRPGFETKYKIVYFNKGTTTLSGSAKFEYPQNFVMYPNYTVAPNSNTNGVMTWNFTNLAPFQQKEIIVGLTVNTPTHPTYPVNAGQVLSYTATVNPVSGDSTPADNVFSFNDTVVNSFDPNDKACLEGSTISPSMVGGYLHYLIRFENTGTANAINVVLKDVLDASKLDVSSLQPISASHPYRVSVTDGNKLEVNFDGIQLSYPPYLNRSGYFLFKIKTKPTVAVGEVIKNKADIYFDYNSPILTNEYQTVITQVLGTQEITKENLGIYPNPAADVLNIKTKENIKSINIYDASGRQVKTLINPESKIDVKELNSGNYIIKITTGTSSYQSKFIKK
ncbi:T9SS type A sorting domain-containing protein [Chryseobacterium sp. SIMBA_029]|uniref:DUF7619 domain-containing protein n=2 Tax=unclassified Chryseobacterium TaxID=2593645 RepID=UPI003978F694